MLKAICISSLCFLVSLPLFAAQWQTKYSSFAIHRSPERARKRAEQEGNQKVGPMYQLCRDFNGSPKHWNLSSNRDCQLWGQEEFHCKAVTTVTCELGEVQPSSENSIEGSYLDELTGAFVHISSDHRISMNIMSPYAGGRDLKEIGLFQRTGEDTYFTEGSFVSAEGCSTTARFDFSHLSDGTLLVRASSPERVSAIIFGACRWVGELNVFYELKKITFVE